MVIKEENRKKRERERAVYWNGREKKRSCADTLMQKISDFNKSHTHTVTHYNPIPHAALEETRDGQHERQRKTNAGPA